VSERDSELQGDAGEDGVVEQAIALLRTPVATDADGFRERVLAAVGRSARPAPVIRRAVHPRAWIAAAALAAAAAIAVLAAPRLTHRAIPAAARGGAGRVQHVQHVPHSSRLVQFRLVAPAAATVAVAGSFNAWSTSATPLRRVGRSTWVAEVPLRAGRYVYQFVIDRHQWVRDPAAPEDPADDFGTRNSVVTVVTPSGS